MTIRPTVAADQRFGKAGQFPETNSGDEQPMPGKKRSQNFASVTDRLRAVGTDLTGTDAQQVASVQQQVEAIGRGDFEAALAHAAPDVELEIYAPPDFPFVRRAKGTQEVRQAIESNFGAVEDQRPVIANVITQGNVVVLFGTEHGRIRATGATYHVEFVHRFTFANGSLQNIRVIVARAA